MLLLAGLLALAACDAGGPDDRPPPAPAPAPGTDEPPRRLLEEARERGTVLVVAELDVPYRPEAELGRDEIAEQRAAIARAQEELLEELEGHQVVVAGRPERLPQLALRVDEPALRALARSPLVRDLGGNVPEPPAGS